MLFQYIVELFCCLNQLGDVDGSVEAILDVLDTYHNPDVPLQVVHYGVGDTTPNDLELASLFKGKCVFC